MNRDQLAEARDEVMDAPNLLEFFCRRTAEDFRARARREIPGLPWAGMGLSFLLAVVFLVAGQSTLSRIFFGLLVVQALWTVWVLVVRSNNQIQQQAEDAARGYFPAEAAPLVSARLRWWNHLISPRRWARHSRVYGRRSRLQKRIAEIGERLEELKKSPETKALASRPPPSLPVHLRNRVAIEERLQSAQRLAEEVPRLQEELQVYEALLEQIDGITEKLDRIAALSVTVRDGAQADLTQMVADAMTILEERRALVRELDSIDPEEFIGMISL